MHNRQRAGDVTSGLSHYCSVVATRLNIFCPHDRGLKPTATFNSPLRGGPYDRLYSPLRGGLASLDHRQSQADDHQSDHDTIDDDAGGRPGTGEGDVN